MLTSRHCNCGLLKIKCYLAQEKTSLFGIVYLSLEYLSKQIINYASKCDIVGKTESIKYWGLILNHKLNWKHQLANLN